MVYSRKLVESQTKVRRSAGSGEGGGRIYMVTQVPIGMINTSRGGTTVEAWTPMARLQKSDIPVVKELVAKHDKRIADFDPKAELAKQIRKYESKIADMKKKGKKIPASMRPPTGPITDGHMLTHRPPGNCYSSVISPIAGFAVKGAIFHQGYNNCFSGVWGATMYRAVFPELIRGWREAFNDPKMPFGILSQCVAGKVQDLNNFLPYMTDIGARLREAQYQTFLEFYKGGDKKIGTAWLKKPKHFLIKNKRPTQSRKRLCQQSNATDGQKAASMK